MKIIGDEKGTDFLFVPFTFLERMKGTFYSKIKAPSQTVVLTSRGSAKFLEGIDGFVALKVINGILPYSLS
ncbi:hypothetical protein M3699_07350 [Peribacillus simplex]|uniref:hypothetical protein n=1 Tax=Peribacillus simplex TaxID=1478 RepID=UPI00203B45DB|nr:hypothetical protein [Peribacillus simplex]MCM3673702.1 hypothetical protein [Peribacillus simplex]